MAPLKPEHFNTPCIEKLAQQWLDTWIVNEIITKVLYSPDNSKGVFNSVLSDIWFQDNFLIDTADDMMLFLEWLNDKWNKEDFIRAIGNYREQIKHDKTKDWISQLLSKVQTELYGFDTLERASSLYTDDWYIQGSTHSFSHITIRRIQRKLNDNEIKKSHAAKNKIINKHINKTWMNEDFYLL